MTNLQGDVLAILDGNKQVVASYSYDPYGKVLSATGTLAEINPLRYRGYVYDSETGFYYLQSRYYDPTICRFINADSYASTGQGIVGCNMFSYCGNNPVNKADPTGEFGILSTLAVAGIAISAIVGGLVAGASTALSGGSVGEVIASAAIGAVTAGAIATVAALGAAGTLTAGTVALVSGGIGAVGEATSIAVEYAYHKNDENYTFDLASATNRVIYAAGISAFSGWVSYGINKIYTGADEIIGVCVSGEATVALGLVDFGVRQLISVASSSSQVSNSPSGGGTVGSKQIVAIAY